MSEAPIRVKTTIRPAVAADADGITRTYMESAEYHAQLDPERCWIPAAEAISARYRQGRQHPQDGGQAITLVAELNGEIVGFVDARLERSPDPMLREFDYCHIAEIAVSSRQQNRGIGGLLLQAAEDWGRRAGAEFASLDYLSANTRAGALYHRMGYGIAAMKAVKRL
jgi:ribosomal protein S18 acetylase RimI-like enzyme